MAEVTWEDLKARISKGSIGAPTDALIQDMFNVAEEFVSGYIGVQTVGEATRNAAILNDGQELLKRTYNPQGSSQGIGSDGQLLPFRLSKDPHVTTRALLDPYLVGGF